MTRYLAHCHNKLENLNEYGVVKYIGRVNMDTETCDTPETFKQLIPGEGNGFTLAGPSTDGCVNIYEWDYEEWFDVDDADELAEIEAEVKEQCPDYEGVLPHTLYFG